MRTRGSLFRSAVGVVAVFFALGVASATETRAAQSAKALYEAAQAAESQLRDSSQSMGERDNWTEVARKYRAVVVSHPRSGYCDDALWFEGGIYRDAAERFNDRGLAVRSADAYALLIRGYPASKWVPRAFHEQVQLYAGRIGDLSEARAAAEQLQKTSPSAPEVRLVEAVLEPPTKTPAPDKPATASDRPKARPTPASPPATVENIRHWVGKSHTRVVIDLSKEAPYTEGRLENPDRVFFDLHGAHLADEMRTRLFPIEGSHLRRIRVGNPESEVVRVVLDFSSIQDVTVFGLPDPYRLVVDIHGAPPVMVAGANEAEAEKSAAAPTRATTSKPSSDSAPDLPERTDSGYSLARQLGAGVRRVAIDAGHGGKDPGTSTGRLREKDIALDIAKQVRTLLEADGFEVVMTREKDVFVPLEQRAFIANDAQADIFISIHVNAARNRRARGLETFYLNLATSPDAAEVAARENAVNSEVRLSELPKLVEQIMNHNRIEESRELATAMQFQIVQQILGGTEHPLNRGVKTAGFHVLLGAQMPAVLVEVGFVSNSEEAKQLSTDAHRTLLAEAITEGVRHYARTLGQLTSVATDKSP